MPFNKKWKVKDFKHLSVKNTEKIAARWILTELNPLKRENL